MISNRSAKLLAFAAAVSHALEAASRSIDSADAAACELNNRIADFHRAIETTEAARRTESLASSRLAIADKALKNWLTKARLVVMLSRGLKWSESWIPTGFTGRTSRIPAGIEARVMLGRALVAFFARQPECGVPFAEVTAARGRNLYERVTQSAEMLRLARDDRRIVDQQRRIAEIDLRRTLRGIVSCLRKSLAGSDGDTEALASLLRDHKERRGNCAVALADIAYAPQAHRRPERAAAA